jgi:hypothetical protein
MNEDDMAARHIEPNLLVEMESLTEGSNVAPTASGFNSRPYNVLRGSFGACCPVTNPANAELSRQEE